MTVHVIDRQRADVVDVVARRRDIGWEAMALAVRNRRAYGETSEEAIERLVVQLETSGDDTRRLRGGLLPVLYFVLASRVRRDTEYFRIPRNLVDEETATVLRDHEAMADLEQSEADVAAGRVTSLAELRRELGRD